MNLLLCPAASRVMHNARHELQFDPTNEKKKQNETETVENKLKLTCNASPKYAMRTRDKGNGVERVGGESGTHIHAA